MPLTEEEKNFLAYWEANREKEKRLSVQLMAGLPLGIIFSVPILLNFLAGRFWYKRADSVGVSQFNPWVLVIAILLIAVFIGVFSKKHKWDQREQRYLEIRRRAEKNQDTPFQP
jgi:hypothetical protein